MQVALAVLKLAGPLPIVPTDPTDPEEYIRQQVEQERERRREENDSLDGMLGLPSTEHHHETVRRRLSRLSGPAGGDAALPLNGAGEGG